MPGSFSRKRIKSGLKRSNNACQACRRRKIKCSGSQPCSRCTENNMQCVFAADEGKVQISRGYLRRLEQHAAGATSPHCQSEPTALESGETINGTVYSGDSSTAQADHPGLNLPSVPANAHDNLPGSNLEPSHVAGGGVTVSNDSLENVTNPLATGTFSGVVDRTGRERFLGESSTWSFSQQTLNLLRRYQSLSDSQPVPINSEGSAWSFSWSPHSRAYSSQEPVLPSYDHALHLKNTLKFHIGQLLHLFDDEVFTNHLHYFYERHPMEDEGEGESKIWYVQFLVTLAFGRAMENPGMSNGLSLALDLFSCSLSRLPDYEYLHRYPLTAVETLSAIALFFQSLDMRNVAYIYIGTAQRLALSSGFHRNMPWELGNSPHLERRRKVWWTVYILDRYFSLLMGNPPSLRDEAVTTSIEMSQPPTGPMAPLALYVQLSQLTAQMFEHVYGADGRIPLRFLESIQIALRKMALLAPELEMYFPLSLNGTNRGISRVAAHLHLSYHHCIILATRPLLLSALKLVLDYGGPKKPSKAVLALFKRCAESAQWVLSILAALREQALLQSFLPFDLEHISSAAFVLRILSVFNSALAYRSTSITSPIELLDEIIVKGYKPANFRKMELEQLGSMIDRWEAEHEGCTGPAGFVRNERSSPVLPTVDGFAADELIDIASMFTVEGVSMDENDRFSECWLWESPLGVME